MRKKIIIDGVRPVQVRRRRSPLKGRKRGPHPRTPGYTMLGPFSVGPQGNIPLREEIARYRQLGYSHGEIAKFVGRSRQRVQQIWYEMGGNLSARHYLFPKDIDQRIRNKFKLTGRPEPDFVFWFWELIEKALALPDEISNKEPVRIENLIGKKA